MSNIILKDNPKLSDFQEYMRRMNIERGFDNETLPELFMLFMEECGEMAKAARKLQNIKTDEKAKTLNMKEEIADVFIYLLEIANHYKIDLEQAFRMKEEKNKKRSWK